jgi:hypothetical protein
MRKWDIEFTVGLFLIAGIICLGYLSIKLGRMEASLEARAMIFMRFFQTAEA